jgi:Cys-rich protein (TIGR01571 family)
MVHYYEGVTKLTEEDASDDIADESGGLPEQSGTAPVAYAVAVPLISGTPSSESRASAPCPLVEITAPMTLAAGYQLDIELDGVNYKCQVPTGGVEAGQKFNVKAFDLESTAALPMDRWRDDLCDCCRFGCCHPVICLGFWCNPVLLAQVMTRLKLNWNGEAGNKGNTFKVIVGVWIAFILVRWALGLGINYGNAQILQTVIFYLDIAFFIFIIVLAVRTRSYLRARSNIPERNCAGCEDCCCVFWCSCCTLTQMARHTYDFDKYQAVCCNSTGIASGVAEIV